jgi:cell shape-determining protein MreC
MFYVNKKIVLWFVIVLATFFIANRVFFFKKQGFLEDSASTFMYPVLWCAGNVSYYLEHKIKKERSHQKLKLKYKKLKSEYYKVLDEVVRLTAFSKYYQMSQELRDFQERYKLENMLLCKILAKNFSSSGHYFIINRGTENGVRKNMGLCINFNYWARLRRFIHILVKLFL